MRLKRKRNNPSAFGTIEESSASASSNGRLMDNSLPSCSCSAPGTSYGAEVLFGTQESRTELRGDEEDPLTALLRSSDGDSRSMECHQQQRRKSSHKRNFLFKHRKRKTNFFMNVNVPSAFPLLFLICSLQLHVIFSQAIFERFASAPSYKLERYNNKERAVVRDLFLRRFGLQHIAETISGGGEAPTKPSKLPSYIWDLYELADSGESHFDVIRHYSPSTVSTISSLNLSNVTVSWQIDFNLTAASRNAAEERILGAQLRIATLGLREAIGRLPLRGELRLLRVEPMNSDKKHLISSQHIDLTDSANEFIDFNILQAFRELPEGEEQVHFLLEYCLSSSSSDESLSILFDNKLSRYSALSSSEVALMVFTANAAKEESTIDDAANFEPLKGLTRGRRRYKRSTAAAANKAQQHRKRKHRKHHIAPKDSTQCKRSELYVDFVELNWQDWIISPVGYEAYQCRGKCMHPMPAHLNTTNHAIIQSLINSIDPGAVPAPSCVPVEMSPITILYRDINNIVVVKTYPDMKVDACGCH